LKLVDTSRVSVALPISERLLVVARENSNGLEYTSTHYYTIGYLDITNQRFIQLSRVKSYPPVGIEWKPDGTQFIYNTRGIGVGASSTWIFQADGKELFQEGMSASWIGDGQYVSVWTGRAPNLSGGGTVSTVYDTESWEAVCQLCYGQGVFMQCYAPCAADEILPSEGTTEPESYEQRTKRYDVAIENKGLRVVNTITGIEQTFVLPNHHIVMMAWSPIDYGVR